MIMGSLLVYILKSAFCLAAFYLFYTWLLSRETFHRFNRMALLGGVLLASVLPLVGMAAGHPQEAVSTLVGRGDPLAPVVPQPVNAKASSWWTFGLLLAYAGGVMAVLCGKLVSLARLLAVIRSGRRETLAACLPGEGGALLAIHEKGGAPFSWMHFIVVTRKDLEENARPILLHELAHVRCRHSWDLLLADLCICLQWFNPAAWLIKRELQTVHEYEADEAVLRAGVEARQYQLLLIKKAVGTRRYSLANSLSHSNLKKRITMMQKRKSNQWARAKCLYVLPLAAVALTAFARPEVSEVCDQLSTAKVTDFGAFVKAESVENAIPQDSARDRMISLSIVRTSSESGSDDPLIVVNDRVQLGDFKLDDIDPSQIKSVYVLKGEEAQKAYGEQGKNGVIQIFLKDAGKAGENAEAKTVERIWATGVVKDRDGKPVTGAIVRVAGTNEGVVSDKQGAFAMQVPEGAELEVMYIGTRTVKTKAQPNLTVTLEFE